MKVFAAFVGIVAVVLLLVTTQGFSQTGAISEKSASGELIKVDTTAQVISVRLPDSQEMNFNYKSSTKIVNPDEKTKGLAQKVGSRLIVTYVEENKVNWATQIQLVE
jgi:hypothetical protein